MARIYGIKKLLPQYGVSESQAKEIIGSGELTGVIRRMETSLSPDTLRGILDSLGCGGGKDYIKKLTQIGKALAGKSIDEKVSHINNSGSGSETIALNGDGTLTVTMRYVDNDKYRCVCSAAVKNGVKVSDLTAGETSSGDSVMPLSYCFCCAGSYRRHLQLQLGAELQTKEIVSSPISSKGQKPCEFVFEMTGTE